MSDNKKIKRALISVFHKEGLADILRKLHENGVELVSTGGTQKFIESQGFPCEKVEEETGYPSILGGRVKTLHPKVFGGILSRRDLAEDVEQCGKYDIKPIDLVIVDLYPFEDTVASGASEAEIIEKIDIGGIALIRAAAKNFKDVVIVASKAQYGPLLDILKEKENETSLEDRKWFAKEAFSVSSQYDTDIFNWFDGNEHSAFRSAYDGSMKLRYGENPHQKGFFCGDFDDYFEKLHGKEISYNNLGDIDAAVNLIQDFDETTFVIMKHNNACGIASRPELIDAYKAALAGDPVSAYGGVYITNVPIDAETAGEINKMFVEVLIAPGYDPKALEILECKKNRVLLVQKKRVDTNRVFRSALTGVLVQDKDLHTEKPEELKPVTTAKPDAKQIEDLLFANKVVKHSKSNSIVLAKNKQLCASGVGQTSRVDALKQAVEKAKSFNFDLQGAVMASDAFFPFSDCVEIADKAGITSVIQPGGSVRDKDSIAYCEKNGLSMVFTGIRHFKH